MAENEEQKPAPAQPVDENAVTVYGGLTVGQIVADRDLVYQQSQAKDTQLLKQSDRIVELEKTLKEHDADTAALRARAEKAEARVAVQSQTAGPAMQKMADGSLRLMITVPEEQAIPLLSWAEGAGEDPQTYITKIVEDAMVSVISS